MKKQFLGILLAVFLVFGMTGCKKVAVTAPGSLSTQTPVPSEPVRQSDRDIFMAFLNGESEAVIDQDCVNNVIVAEMDDTLHGDSVSVSALTNMVKDYVTWEDGMEVDVVCRYTFARSLSAQEVLVLEYEERSTTAGYSYYFVFTVRDGQPRLAYAQERWARNWTELMDSAVFLGHGSAGAGDSFEWVGYIDRAGNYSQVYDLESLYDLWVSMAAYQVFGFEDEWSEDCACYLLDIGKDKFFQLEVAPDTDPDKVAILRGYLMEEDGRAPIDSAQDVIRERKAACGIPDELRPYSGEWITLAV